MFNVKLSAEQLQALEFAVEFTIDAYLEDHMEDDTPETYAKIQTLNRLRAQISDF